MTQQTITESRETLNRENNHLIDLEMLRKNGELKLYIKISSEFEKWLSVNKKLTHSEDFCKTGQKVDFYEGKIENNGGFLDGQQSPMFSNGQLNLAILRIKGISEGIELNVNQLIPLTEIDKIFKDFVFMFRKYYKDYLKPFKIKCSITAEDFY